MNDSPILQSTIVLFTHRLWLETVNVPVVEPPSAQCIIIPDYLIINPLELPLLGVCGFFAPLFNNIKVVNGIVTLKGEISMLPLA